MSNRNSINVLGTPLMPCCSGTGIYRDGSCHVPAGDTGNHSVCAIVTDAFLQQQAWCGNDLITPIPQQQFPGLKAGDKWCLCAKRWMQGYEQGIAPAVILESTNHKALQDIPLQVLQAHAVKDDS
ncbi:MAG: DUF2237 domain-containing protein [Pseudomonadota bacterium]